MRRTMAKTAHRGIYRVDDGYFIRVRVKDPRTGKLREVNCTREGIGLKEARAVLERLRVDALESKAQTSRGMTLTAYAQSWLARGLPNWKRSTQERYVQALEQHILPYLGDILVDQIRRSDVEEWKAAMTRRRKPTVHVKAKDKAKKKAANRSARPYQAKTINSWFRVLTVMLGDAVADFSLDHNPVFRVKELPERNPYAEETNCLQAGEVWPFLNTFQTKYPRFYPLVVVALFCGLRWGETSALVWGDLDESQASPRIRISKAQYHGTLSTTKTGETRVVPVNPFIVDVLHAYRASQAAAKVPVGAKDLIFPSERGLYRYPSLLRPAIRAVLKDLDIQRNLTVHGLRRTYNNLMRQAVTDTILVQAMTGHSSDRMTEHYSHVSLEEKSGALQKLFDKLGPGLADPLGTAVPTPETDDVPDA